MVCILRGSGFTMDLNKWEAGREKSNRLSKTGVGWGMGGFMLFNDTWFQQGHSV